MGLNKPVEFSTAKLLKEKGFEQDIQVGVICRIQNIVNKYYEKIRLITQSDLDNEWCIFNEIYPTIAEVVMWLYKNMGIWIVVNFANKNQWYFDCNNIGKSGKEKNLFQSNYDYNTPTEAYLVAIEYTLNNLI